ncbi:MAG: hypothetical protein JKY54_04860, partial [Flavobacteriales bacterium]|nr:hypothetical protein [Flavobacteriales bacterium]
TATAENIKSGNGFYSDVFSVYKYGIPVVVTDVIEGATFKHEFMETSQDGSQSFENIESINTDVNDQLSDNSIWKNYFYNGSIWIDTEGYETVEEQAALLNGLGGGLSSSKPGELTRGSVAAYNLTMETYVQIGFPRDPYTIHGTTVENLANCFACHNANLNDSTRSPLYISHVFNGYLHDLNGLSKMQIKQKHIDHHLKQYLQRLSK